MSGRPTPRIMPRDSAPERLRARDGRRPLPNDEPAEVIRSITDDLARWSVEHDPRRDNPIFGSMVDQDRP